MAFSRNDCGLVCTILYCHLAGNRKGSIYKTTWQNFLFVCSNSNCGDAIWKIWRQLGPSLVDILPGANAGQCVAAAGSVKDENQASNTLPYIQLFISPVYTCVLFFLF